MIHINRHEITGVYSGSKDIQQVYKGLILVWNKTAGMIFCCFSNGYWMDEHPWIDTEVWTD